MACDRLDVANTDYKLFVLVHFSHARSSHQTAESAPKKGWRIYLF